MEEIRSAFRRIGRSIGESTSAAKETAKQAKAVVKKAVVKKAAAKATKKKATKKKTSNRGLSGRVAADELVQRLINKAFKNRSK